MFVADRIFRNYMNAPYSRHLEGRSSDFVNKLTILQHHFRASFIMPLLYVLSESFVVLGIVGVMFVLVPELACSVILAGGGAFAVRWIRERKKIPSEDFLFQCALLLTVFGFVGAYLMARIALPRYMAAASFPAFLLLALNLPRFRRCAAVLLIPIGLLAPLFYKELPFGIRRSGEYLERSREYLNDIASNRRLCSFLERFREDPVVVSWPLAQMLTMPEMGYVKKPFPKVYSGRIPFYAPVRKLEMPYGKMPPETVFVYHENDFENTGMSGPSLLPDRTCVSLYRDTTLGGLVIVYRRENPPVSGPVRESQPRAE